VTYLYPVVPDKVKIACFSCGEEMTFIKEGDKTRECRKCEVTELRLQGEYIIMTRQFTSCMFYGEEVRFADHSKVHWPHP
jgi:hypothetical protein